jgi:sulfonate transport system permease protein
MSTSSPARPSSGFNWRGAVLPLLLIAAWLAATAFGWVNTRLIVPPWGVVKTAIVQLGQVDFWLGVVYSLFRDVSGFTFGAFAGIAIGTLMGVSRWSERLIGPTFHTLRQISLFAWLPLLSSWLDTGDLSKIVFVGLSTFYPVVLGTFEGVRNVTRAQAEVAKVYEFTRSQLLFRLILPAAAPQILTGLRLGLIYAWLATIGAEFLLANYGNGLGNIVFKGRAGFNVELILFGMLVIGFIGYGFNRLADFAERRVLKWRQA